MCKKMQQEQGSFLHLQVSYVSLLFVLFPKETCIQSLIRGLSVSVINVACTENNLKIVIFDFSDLALPVQRVSVFSEVLSELSGFFSLSNL